MTAKKLKQELIKFRAKIMAFYNILPKGKYDFPRNCWIEFNGSVYELRSLIKTAKGAVIYTRSRFGYNEKTDLTALRPDQLVYIAEIIEDDIQNKKQGNISQ